MLIGRILQYGYRGGISTSWKSQNESDANCIAHAYATQILIWETIVGERDAGFNHVSTGGYNAVLECVSSAHPLRSKILSYYNSIGGTNLGAKQKSIIDRCTASVYRDYQQRGYTGTVPTLQDFRAELLKQDEPEAKEIALAIELFTHGSLNTFAKPTNVDTDNRLICYDILDLGKQLNLCFQYCICRQFRFSYQALLRLCKAGGNVRQSD